MNTVLNLLTPVLKVKIRMVMWVEKFIGVSVIYTCDRVAD